MNTFKYSKIKYLAFTLAEVLIVLGIIGIVAALTIPTLMQNAQEHATSVALKKNFTVFSNAYKLAVNENGGTPESWDLPADAYEGALKTMSYFTPYLKVLKNCGANAGCFPDTRYFRLNGTVWGNANDYSIPKIQLTDGSLITYSQTSNNCDSVFGTTAALKSVCGYFYVDVNGFKKPNAVGIDFFLLYLTKYGIIPTGVADDNHYSFGDCVAHGAGWGCTAWVIYNGNMDYLKPCKSELGWNAKSSCD